MTPETIKVLDKGEVTLIDYYGSDQRIADAARTSYGSGTKRLRSDEGLIDFLVRHGHGGPTEFVDFTFFIKCPIFVARQLHRYRTGSYSELSGRYSEMPDEFYLPPPERIKRQSETNKQASGEPFKPHEAHNEHSWFQDDQILMADNYRLRLDRGVSRELARINLPLSTYTRYYFKTNLRNLFNLLEQRLAPGAQDENAAYAQAILQLIRPLVPVTVAAWENHVRKAVRFSADEMWVLQSALDLNSDIYKDMRAAAEAKGMKASRVREFMAKFGELA